MTRIEWNNNHEILLNKIAKQCSILAEVHKYAARFYEKRSRIFGTPLVILGSVTTSTIFANSSYEYMPYISGAMALAMTVFTSLGNLLSYGDRTILHNKASISYEEIGLDIAEQITYFRENRREIDEYMKYVMDSFIRLKKNSPSISIGIYNKFTQDFDSFISKMKKLDGTNDDVVKTDVFIQVNEISLDRSRSHNIKSFYEIEHDEDESSSSHRGFYSNVAIKKGEEKKSETKEPERATKEPERAMDRGKGYEKFSLIGAEKSVFPVKKIFSHKQGSVSTPRGPRGQSINYHIDNMSGEFERILSNDKCATLMNKI